MDTSKAQIQEVAQMKEGDGKHCSLLGQGKKAEYSNVQSPNKRKDDEHRARQTSSVREKTLEKNQVKRKSPLKHKIMHEATPENLQCSPRKDKEVQKKLKLDMTESVGIKQFPVKNDTGGSSSEESSGDEGVAWEDVDGMYCNAKYYCRARPGRSVSIYRRFKYIHVHVQTYIH